MGVAILLECGGGGGGGGGSGGSGGSFSSILPGRIHLEERRAHAGNDRHCESLPGVINDEDEEDGG